MSEENMNETTGGPGKTKNWARCSRCGRHIDLPSSWQFNMWRGQKSWPPCGGEDKMECVRRVKLLGVEGLDGVVGELLDYLAESSDCEICGNDVEKDGHEEGTHCWNVWTIWKLRKLTVGEGIDT